MSHSNSAGCLLNDVEKIKKNCARYFLNNCRENRTERSRNAYSTITARHLSDNCRQSQIQIKGREMFIQKSQRESTLSEQNAQSSRRRLNTERAKCLLNNRREDEIGSARDINVTITETNKPTVFLTPK